MKIHCVILAVLLYVTGVLAYSNNTKSFLVNMTYLDSVAVVISTPQPERRVSGFFLPRENADGSLTLVNFLGYDQGSLKTGTWYSFLEVFKVFSNGHPSASVKTLRVAIGAANNKFSRIVNWVETYPNYYAILGMNPAIYVPIDVASTSFSNTSDPMYNYIGKITHNYALSTWPVLLPPTRNTSTYSSSAPWFSVISVASSTTGYVNITTQILWNLTQPFYQSSSPTFCVSDSSTPCQYYDDYSLSSSTLCSNSLQYFFGRCETIEEPALPSAVTWGRVQFLFSEYQEYGSGSDRSAWAVIGSFHNRLFAFDMSVCFDINVPIEDCVYELGLYDLFDYSCAAIDAQNKILFVGTLQGMAVQISLETMQIISSVYLSSSPLTAVVADPSARVSFWLAPLLDTGDILRIHYDSFAVENILRIPVSGIQGDHSCSPSGSQIVTEQYSVPGYGYIYEKYNLGFFVGLRSNSCNYNSYFISFKLSDCSRYKSCSECLSEDDGDPWYCSWNHYSQTCFRTYEQATLGLTSDSCDNVMKFVSPATVPDATPTTLNITFNKDMDAEESLTKECVFSFDFAISDNRTTATISGTVATCPTVTLPTDASVKERKGYVTLEYNQQPVVTNKLPLTFTSCENRTDCSSCLLVSGCNWCTFTQNCAPTCDYETHTGAYECPALFNIDPTASRAGVSTSVSIYSNYIPTLTDSINYVCYWTYYDESTISLQSTATTDSTLLIFTCASPVISKQVTVELSLYWRLGSGSLSPFVNSDDGEQMIFDFDVQGCSQHTTCSECAPDEDSLCVMCVDPDVGVYCTDVDTCATHVTGSYTDLCPEISTIEPAFIDLNANSTTLQITLSTDGGVLTVLPEDFNYKCDFSDKYHSTATIVSADNRIIECSIPYADLGTISAGNFLSVSVSAFKGTDTAVTLVGTTYYLPFISCWSDGEPETDCSSCISSSFSQCGWCLTSRECASQYSCSSGSVSSDTTLSIGKCPGINSARRNDTGNTLPITPGIINVVGSIFSNVTTLFCFLNDTTRDTQESASAIVLDANHLQCDFTESFDPVPSSQDYISYLQFSVLQEVETKRADTLSYAVYATNMKLVDCGGDRNDDVQGPLCDNCLNYRPSECSWDTHIMRCTMFATASYSSEDSTLCATIASVEPQSGCAETPQEVIITLSNRVIFLNDSRYNVSFGGVVVDAEVVDNSTLRVISPVYASSDTVDLVVFYLNRQFTYEVPTRTFQYLKCSSDSAGGNDNALIIGVVVGVGGFLIICAIVLIVVGALVYRHNKKSILDDDFKFDLSKKPDFSKFQFDADFAGGSLVASTSKKKVTVASPELAQALLNIEVVRAVCEVTQATESDKVTSALVYLYSSSGRALDLISTFIQDEVNRVQSESLLFRSNSFASKMFRAYSKLVGLEYLWYTLATFMAEMAFLSDQEDKKSKKLEKLQESGVEISAASMLNTDIEVDPTKMMAGLDEDAQCYLLAQRSRKLLVSVLKSKDNMPISVRMLVKQIRDQVTKKFPEVENIAHIAIGGVIFLRFVWRILTLMAYTYRFVLPLLFHITMAY